MFKKRKYLLVLVILLVVFTSIIITNAQDVPIANSFRFPLEGDWSPLWQDFGKWNNQWNGYHLGEDVGREDADVKEYAVYPMADGIVKFADIVMGYTVIIEHKLSNDDPDGDYVCSVYYHMKRPEEGGIKLTVGESVSIDSPIGYVSGKWGDYKSSPHLHFGIRRGRYKIGKDLRTGFWFYPGYTAIKKDGEVQKDPDNPIHKQVLADWFDPTTLPGFIERHIIQKKQTLDVSEYTEVINAFLSPSEIIESFIKAINEGDLVSAEKYVAPDIKLYSLLSRDWGDESQIKSIEYISGKIQKIEIKGERIEDDKAVVVTVTILRPGAKEEACAKWKEEFPFGHEYELVCGQSIYIDGTITWRLTKWGEEWMVSDCNNVESGEFKRTWK